MPEPSQVTARVLLSPDGSRVAVRGDDTWRRWRVLAEGVAGDVSVHEDDLIGWLPMVGVRELISLSIHWNTAADEKSGECGHEDCCFPHGVRAARADVEDMIIRVEGATWAR